jgi:hypothetical protein
MTTASIDVADVTIFNIIHRGLRQDVRRFAALVATLEPTSTGRAFAARRWLRGFCAELHEHHTVEDTIFYPALVERVPTVAEPLGRVDVDHQRLDAVVAEIDRLVGTIVDGDATPATCAAARRAADELTELLIDHLDLEDADLLPLFVRHFTPAEYEELTQQAMKQGKLADLAYAVPWIMDHATPEERSRILADAPLPLRLIWIATRRRYARMVANAFAGIPAPPRPASAGVAQA